MIRLSLLPALITALLASASNPVRGDEDTRPNVLWITIEDWGPDLSCYGTKGIHTPNVDKLASQGVRYQWAFTTSPVCSTSRSAMMTGYHQNFIGANQHREHNKRALPHGIKPLPHLMKEAGYFTALMSKKTDCNFVPNTKEELFEGTDWNQRGPGQPFFARISFGGTHRSWNRDPLRPVDPADVELPPYYVDTPFVRRDWANGLEQMQLVDREVGAILKRLRDEGLADNTIVFFIGDHGRCHIRGKQFLYDGGIRIPMIMRWPGKVDQAQVNHGLVTSLDICATVLEVAGATPAVSVHGKSLLDPALKDRKYVFAARDKMDETHDAMRAVRSMNHKLILNLMPERPYCQFNRYKEGAYPVLAEMNIKNLEGKLTPQQAAFFAPSKPKIELYDLEKDPHEVNNVAELPSYADVKTELLAALDDWRQNVIHDEGVTETFRANDAFPETCPVSSVDVWVDQNPRKLDFNQVGWPSWYPTRSLEEWKAIRRLWEPYVMRAADAKVTRPTMVIPNKQPVVMTDDFSDPSLASRKIAAGEWTFKDTIGAATHDSPDKRSEKKHGPKLFYQANIT
ncbi:MAG: sulfatase, partial [Planctomycetota bacterium]